MKPNERKRLIDRLLEDDLSDEEIRELESELSTNPDARQEYYDRVELTVLLESESSGPAIRPATIHRFRNRSVAVAVAVMAMTLVVSLLYVFNSPKGKTNRDRIVTELPEPEQQVSGYAIIAGQTDTHWADGRKLPNGSLVPSGRLHLVSGIVKLELFSGVTVVVEGDSEFAVLSSMKVAVDRGKVRAFVPEPAQGFRLQTREGEVVDLGTEFAVRVTPDHSDVHVLDGDIEWHPRSRSMQRMTRGNALRWRSSGNGRPIDSGATTFVGATELQKRLVVARDTRRSGWDESCRALGEDARLVAHFRTRLTQERDRQLRNMADGRTELAGNGTIVATSRSTDRWGRPGGACDFSPTGSRVRLSVPGSHRSITLACWVKINSLDRWYNSLFLTDGHEANEPHWQIMDDGRLFFSVKKRDEWDSSLGQKDKHIYYSPSFWDSSLAGQWLMIATVYDVDDNVVTHYLNGEHLSQESIPSEYLVENVQIGNASICNWSEPERDESRFAVRNLNGSLDEFFLFSAALSDDEIQSLYERSRP